MRHLGFSRPADPLADGSRMSKPTGNRQRKLRSIVQKQEKWFSLRQQSLTMTSWVSRLLPRNARSLATSSKNQKAEDCHRQHEAYGYFLPIQTRWQDNDQYGHVNNAVYYSYFDTIINHYLIRYCGLKTSLRMSTIVGFMVSNQCTYHMPIGFPQIPVAALAVEKVGHSSVHYRLALFPPNPTKEPPSVGYCDISDGFFFGHPNLAQFDTLACTTGSSVHVFVNPATNKPTGLPEDFRRGLLKLMSLASV
ncbi:PREDICTED: uncharacterized protein LOC103586658 [Galeopterus variegatus]|uniref:Uncharacterized protein LOC103586658 n=1 Tax=Galeopterus variegatus TaxID=482537 RepID=A0ABM0QCT4_GALVR|nr:PREDICTED: uncharacterized protein LOC103586658 [Galeopterus variegatus]